MMTNKLSEQMKQQQYIRNVSIIAHVDHGKTSLTENLTHIHMDVGMEEKLGITIKAAAVSLPFTRTELHRNNNNNDEAKEIEQTYLINLIDSPGHVDFSSEVTAALRITDGAICVVDCIEGVCVQTETVLRQSILERVKPVLFINKIDRIWLEKHLSINETYKLFKKTIESTNVICHTYKDDTLGDINLNPRKTNIGFGSGYFGWGFTLNHFAKIYGSRKSINHSLNDNKMIDKLWGNNYFDPIKRQWIKESNDNIKYNAFCKYILKPIQILHDSIMNGESDIYLPIISALNLGINEQEITECVKQKEILKLVFSRWFPARQCVLDLCADHLPSPLEAQKYRIPKLYKGPLETKEGQSMKFCDPNGTLSMYISKMIAIKNDPGRFIAFGRVFSGTIKRGQELRILGNEQNNDNINDDNEHKSSSNQSSSSTKKKVTGILMMMGSKYEKLNECPAGNVCGIMGIDKHLTNSGTLSDSDSMFPFETMKFSVSPVVNIAVSVEQKNLKKLIEGLQRLSKIENVLQITQNKQGQQILSGTGELHLRTCLNTLQDELMNGIPIIMSSPIVSFCEGIESVSGSTQTLPSSQSMKKQSNRNWSYPSILCSKSANKHNHIYITSQPLSTEICNDIEFDKLSLSSSFGGSGGNQKEFGRLFKSKYISDLTFSKEDASNIWTFGCPPYGKSNCLIDQTKGIQNMDKIKSSLIQGFIQCTNGGILCDEPLRGIRCNLSDSPWKIHSDPSHRGPGQIIPAIIRACYAAQLSSTPILFEPMYSVDIEVPIDAQNGVFNTLSQCRGEFIKMTDKTDIGIPLCRISGYVPILETLKNEQNKNKDGFTELLRENTKGKAFPVLTFSHWQRVNGDVLINGSISNKFMMEIRQRKGMKLEIPSFHDYYDKL